MNLRVLGSLVGTDGVAEIEIGPDGGLDLAVICIDEGAGFAETELWRRVVIWLSGAAAVVALPGLFAGLSL